MLNESFLGEDGVIYVFFRGDQNAKTVKNTAAEVSSIIRKLRQDHQPALVLNDISEIGKIPLSARREGLAALKDLDFDKLAIIGVSFINSQLVNLIIMVSAKAYKIKCFQSKDEAKQWLRDPHG